MPLTATGEKKITDLQLISSLLTSHMFPIDNGTQSYRATLAQVKSLLAPVYIPSTYSKYKTAGSTTFDLHYAFIVSNASATIGATYTHNAVTYTVIRTVASGNVVILSGNAPPLSSGTLTKASGTGDSTIGFSEYRAPIALRVKCVGAGGGGGGSGHTGAGNGSAGGSSSFGTSLITCTGGAGGTAGAQSSNDGTGGAGGAPTVNSPADGTYLDGAAGGNGQYGYQVGAGGTNYAIGAMGGSSALGGAGANGGYQGNGTTAPAAKINTGSGGGGGSVQGGSASSCTGGGGGAGAYADVEVPAPLSATYAVVVGAKGTGGAQGTAGQVGGAGADGMVEVNCIWQ